MKSVLLSIRPEWCEKIAKGEKTIEIRKNRPKLDTPFKVYIYMTAGDAVYPVTIDGAPYTCSNVGGKCVIGEFVCDEMTPLFNVATTSWSLLEGNVHEYAKGLVRMARLTEGEMHSYAKGKNCYAWHISDLVIYARCKKLTDFRVPCREYDKDRPQCGECEYYYYECNESVGFYDECGCGGTKHITRPPQSWCYVEEETP